MKAKSIIIVALLAILVIYGISVNNGFITAEESVESAWAQVENQYQRRADLIPNLVNTVQGAFGSVFRVQSQRRQGDPCTGPIEHSRITEADGGHAK